MEWNVQMMLLMTTHPMSPGNCTMCTIQCNALWCNSDGCNEKQLFTMRRHEMLRCCHYKGSFAVCNMVGVFILQCLAAINVMLMRACNAYFNVWVYDVVCDTSCASPVSDLKSESIFKTTLKTEFQSPTYHSAIELPNHWHFPQDVFFFNDDIPVLLIFTFSIFPLVIFTLSWYSYSYLCLYVLMFV